MKDHNEDSEFPQGEFPELTRDLAAYGQYLDAVPLEVMPTSVWEQIATTLSLESADRVVPDSPAALGSDPAGLELDSYRKHRIGGKWVGGLVAASVTLLAVGIGVNVLNTDTVDQNSIVAGASTKGDQSQGVPSQGALAAASPQVIQAGFVPPAVQVMESGSDYNSTNLRDTVTLLLSKIGIKKPMDIFMAPMKDMNSAQIGRASCRERVSFLV